MLRQIIQEEIPDLPDFSSISDLPIEASAWLYFAPASKRRSETPSATRHGARSKPRMTFWRFPRRRKLSLRPAAGRRSDAAFHQHAADGHRGPFGALAAEGTGRHALGHDTAGLGSPSSSLKGRRRQPSVRHVYPDFLRAAAAVLGDRRKQHAGFARGRSPGSAPAPSFRTSRSIMIWPPAKRG